MKKRLITGIILVLLLAPVIYFGNYFMAGLTLLLMILGLYEFYNVKKKAKLEKIPLYTYFISLVFSYLMIFDIPIKGFPSFDYANGVLNVFNINIIWIILLAVSLFTSSIFDKKFKLNDVFYLFTTTMYLSLGLKGFLYLRSFGNNIGLFLILYVLIVTCVTDMFAYFGGMTCYKLFGNDKVHKLNERISPKKTIEGTIVGTVFGTICGLVFALIAFKNTQFGYPFYIYLIISLVISICGQIGDLLLSAIKRHFEIKDYSNILPGHGGILDRFDSIILNCMITAIIVSILLL